MADLVLHQRNQRRDDDRHAVAQQGRNLVAQRFAAASGHQHQGITATRNLFDDLLLAATKGIVTENAFKNAEGLP